MAPERARASHCERGRKRAAVCSTPPSGVGAGIKASRSSDGSGELSVEVAEEEEENRGRK